MSITIINETGNVNDTKIINNETGEEISGVDQIELSPMKTGYAIYARITFKKVHLKLNGKVASINSQASKNFE